jgi:HEPN domain-containing protein
MMREEIRRWMQQAESDLEVAGVLIAADRHGATAYHCQQAVEKALKALFMVVRNADAPRTHSLVFLGHETGALERFGDLLRELTPAYTDTRYPDASVETPDEIYGGNRAHRLYDQTTEFFTWIRSELEKRLRDSSAL